MTPEQKQAIKIYVEAISAILYADCDPESLKTLEDIEKSLYIANCQNFHGV